MTKMTWENLGFVSLTRKWASFSPSLDDRQLYRFTPDPQIDWDLLKQLGGGWMYYRFRLINPEFTAIAGVSLARRFWLDSNARIVDFSGFPAFLNRIPEIFFLPRRKTFPESFSMVIRAEHWV